MTVEDSWGLSTAMPTDGQKLRESVRTLMAQCIQKYGGPENYLRMRFATRAAKQDWLNYLGEIQKVDGATSFNVGVDLPISNCNALSEGALLRMHLGSFSFSTAASVRGCPENDVVLKLMDEIMVDGFVTQGDPLLLTQPADLLAEVEEGLMGPWARAGHSSLRPMTVGYYKGRTRVTVLLAILSLLRDHVNPNLAEVHSKLHQSVQVILGKRVQLPSKKDELLGNFKLSVRGSIRKAPNVVPASQLFKICSWFVKDHNANSSKNGQLVGSKAQAVKNILHSLPSKVRQLIVDYTTEVKTLISYNRKMPAGMEAKMQRQQWDRLAEECACVVHMGEEVLNVMPVAPEVLYEAWHQKYIDGDQTVTVEVQSAILARSAGNIRDVGTLNTLLTQHASSCPVPKKDVIGMVQLEKDAFDLTLRQLSYDLQALKVAKSKRSTWEASVYHVKLQHRVQLHEASMNAARWFMDNFCKVIVADTADEMLRHFQVHKQQVINRLRLDGNGCVAQLCNSNFQLIGHEVNFVFINWLAPSTLKNSSQQAQTNFASHCILSSEQNYGAVLMPIFTYKKGQLWMLETSTTRALAMSGLHVDHVWHLCFGKKADLRDGRPCTYPGRLLVHPNAKEKQIWHNCLLMKVGRTAEAEMLHARDMCQVEDVSADALPTTVDDDMAVIQGAQKYQQIGCNAATKILDAALDGVAVDSNGAMFIIDVNPGVGNMFDAFMAKRASVNYNLQYVAMVHEDLSAEWFQETKAQALASGHMAGKVQIPGHAVGSQECPPDLLESEPPLPKLNLMVSRSDLYPEVPPAVIRQWMGTEMSSEMQKFLDSVHEEFGPVPDLKKPADDTGGNANANPDPNKSPPANTSGQKRKASQNSASAGKKAKVDRAKEVDLQTDKLCEAPMLNKGSAIVIHIKTGNRPYLVNASDAAQSLSAGTVVAAFGRGKFIRHQSNAPASEVSNKEVPYDLSGADAQVLYNGNLTTIYEMVEHRRKSGPSPVIKVNYFETIDQPEEGKPGHFKLKKTHDLRFLPQQTVNVEHEGSANGGDNTASQMNLASLLPVEAWASHCTQVLFSVKWAASGLAPIRPQVVLVQDVELAPGRCLALF
ncbi:unnamed protein product [Durusdinium trenchii]|uniref:Uncharacterized protein n=2 Tax=Durusdinium trenchii TaxID=1381693 RepID=A0ABP0LPF8_9DINO